MKKILGILGLLIAVCLVTTLFNGQFIGALNLENLISRTALFGFISIGVAFVIITGGIDLSIGSVIALTGCLLPMFLTVSYHPAEVDFPVQYVQVDHKTVVLAGELHELGKGDRLSYETALGASRHLTVVAREIASGQTSVTVREVPLQLQAAMAVTPVFMRHMSIPLAIGLVLLISLAIGLTHGLLITKLNLQPFVVTLCGLLIYRGVARYLANDQMLGFGTSFEGLKYLAHGKPVSLPVPGLKWISEGNWSGWKCNTDTGERILDGAGNPIPLDLIDWVGIPIPALMLVAVTAAAILLLNYSIYGRYLLALGRNEQAARYSGINTDRMKILAYVLCSLLAGFTGMLFVLDLNSVAPSSDGSFYELYAIAAAVLGGCSLRGGEGSILGVVIGAALMRVLYNTITLTPIPMQLEFVIIGMVILIGVIADELVKRVAARRRARQEAALVEKAA